MTLALIAALSAGGEHPGAIGRDGGLPWRLPADLARFKALTMGHHLIMGRRTYESIGRLLPGRTTIILTRRADYRVPGALAARDLDHALALAGDDPEVFVVGGAEVYALALPRVEKMYLTRVEADVPGDTFFPPVDWSQWRLIADEPHPTDAKNPHPYRFQEYRRG